MVRGRLARGKTTATNRQAIRGTASAIPLISCHRYHDEPPPPDNPNTPHSMGLALEAKAFNIRN